jgi:phage terminase large subunit-like protein
MPDTILIYKNGERSLTSLNYIKVKNKFATIYMPRYNNEFKIEDVINLGENTICLNEYIIYKLSDMFRKEIFDNRRIESVKTINNYFVFEWVLDDKNDFFRVDNTTIEYLPFDEQIVGITTHETTNTYVHCVFNTNHSFIKWLLEFRKACISDQYNLTNEAYKNIISFLIVPTRFGGHEYENLLEYLKKLSDLPEGLAPNGIMKQMNKDMFYRKQYGNY